MEVNNGIIDRKPAPAPLASIGTYPGFYRANVLVRLDPERQHRIKVKCPAIYGDIGEEQLPWCYPMLPSWTESSGQYQGGGFGHVPPIEAPVLICFEGGNPHYPMWIGGWWGNQLAPCQTPNHAFDGSNNPDNCYFTTPRGTTLQIDDRNGVEKILCRLPEGDYISINITGTTQIRPEKNVDIRAPLKVEIQSQRQIEIKTKNASVYATSNVYVQGNSNVHIRGGSSVNVDAGKIFLNSGKSQSVPTGGQRIETNSEQDGK